MKCFIFLLAFFIVVMMGPSSLYGQEKEVTLEQVVVTATRDIQEIRKIPANVTVITKEEIEHSNAQTVIDLMRDEVGVVVRDYYGTGKTASVDIRGFGETGLLNTLVLVDGRRVNQIDLSGVDWTQIPIDQVERIEVVRGAGTVLYGDNAVGGVINIITKRPEKTLSVQGGAVSGSYLHHKESGSVGGKWGPFSAILNAGYHSTEGYRENGFFRAKDVGGKAIYDLNEAIQLNFAAGIHRDDSGLPGELNKALYKTDRRTTIRPEDKAETDDGYGTIGVKAKFGERGRIEADLSYRHREVTDLFRSFEFKDRRNLTTLGFTPKYIFEKTLGSHTNKLIGGLDYYLSDSNVDSESVFFGITFFDGLEITKRSVGLYLFDEFSIFDNLILSLGGRHEWVKYKFLQESTMSKDRVSDREPAWSVGLDYLFYKRSSVFLGVKRSFRFPVSDELIQFFPTFQANPSIRSQIGYHYETGVRHSFNEQVEVNLTLFRVDLRNEIFYNPITFSNENYPKTRRQGVELGMKVRPIPGLSVWGNYTYIKPLLRVDSFSGNDIPGVPRGKGALGMDIDLGRGFLLNTRANFVDSRYFISDWNNRVDKLDGYYTLDAKFSYSWKGLKAFLGANNLFNKKYAEYGVVNAAGAQFYYPSPERNFLGGITYTF